MFVVDKTYEVPSAGAATVRALVASELVDEDAGSSGQVRRAAATGRGAARRSGGTVPLRSVL